MSEKNLSRPPFRFLHDIITQLIKRTGFFKGLFPDELLDSKNVTEKEQKVKFLQAIIACTSLIHGEELEVRASAIVAGKEADKTNLLLATIGQCILDKKSSDEAVEVMKGGGKSKKKEEKREKERKSESKDRKSESKDRKSSRRDRESSKRRPSVTEVEKEKEKSKKSKSRPREDRSKEKVDQSKERSKKVLLKLLGNFLKFFFSQKKPRRNAKKERKLNVRSVVERGMKRKNVKKVADRRDQLQQRGTVELEGHLLKLLKVKVVHGFFPFVKDKFGHHFKRTKTRRTKKASRAANFCTTG